MARVNSMRVTPATCACTIEYGLYRVGSDYANAEATPETIVTQCEVHEAATTAQELHDLIDPEATIHGKAFGLIYGTLNTTNYVVSWTVNESREIDMVIQDVPAVGATLRARLAAVVGLNVTYEVP